MRPDVLAASSGIGMSLSGIPGRDSPDGQPAEEPGRIPEPGPAGPRTPYPVDDGPGIADPGLPGSEPDVVPGRPLDPGIRF